MFKNPWVLVIDAVSDGLNGLVLDADALVKRPQPVARAEQRIGVGAQRKRADGGLRTAASSGDLRFNPATIF